MRADRSGNWLLLLQGYLLLEWEGVFFLVSSLNAISEHTVQTSNIWEKSFIYILMIIRSLWCISSCGSLSVSRSLHNVLTRQFWADIRLGLKQVILLIIRILTCECHRARLWPLVLPFRLCHVSRIFFKRIEHKYVKLTQTPRQTFSKLVVTLVGASWRPGYK